jgi:DNA-binding transcriptional regulator YhcF (GntR family)
MIPPYQRIAAEIRRSIAAGELAPGDRVPSVRQVARDWDVALATATRALSTLRQEGLIEAKPRVGTVVVAASPRPPAARPEAELSRDRVVWAAIAIADSEGLAAVSMRAVAARLGVGVMTPYRHVGGKGELVLLMADAVFGEAGVRPREDADWRDRLAVAARSLWAQHRAHPWLAQIGPLSRPLIVPNLMAYSEGVLSALDGLGLDPTTMFNVNVLIYSHVLGLAVHLEREAHAQSVTGLSSEQWMDGQARTLERLSSAASGCPTFAKVMTSLAETGYDLDLDALFELGLRSIIEGVAALHAVTPRPEGRGGGGRSAPRSPSA